MIEKITSDRIDLLHPSVRQEVRELTEKVESVLTQHSQMRIVQGYRTFPEQHALFLQRPKVTNADAGQSYHNYGLAIDFALLIDGKQISWDASKDFDQDGVADWLEVVKIFVNAGWKWGKAFNDLPHLEKSFGYSWKQLLDKYNKGDFIPGTKYPNL